MSLVFKMVRSLICKFKIRSLKSNHPWWGWGSVNSFCEWEGGVTVRFLMRFQRTFQISNLNLEISNYKYEYENMNSLINKKNETFYFGSKQTQYNNFEIWKIKISLQDFKTKKWSFFDLVTQLNICFILMSFINLLFLFKWDIFSNVGANCKSMKISSYNIYNLLKHIFNSTCLFEFFESIAISNKNCLGSFQVLWNKNCTTENEDIMKFFFLPK